MLVEFLKIEYEIFAEYITLYLPKVKFNLITNDGTLAKSDFVKESICFVEISEDDLFDVMESSLDYEVSVFNVADDKIDMDSESYRLYSRYGWIYDFFVNKYG